MKKYIFILLVFISFFGYAQDVSICSWNLQHFGKSKNDAELNYIAGIVQVFDLIAIQEVVAGYGGSQAVAKLADVLNRSGGQWDYVISPPTSGTGSSVERYAFIWKTSKLKRTGMAWLEANYQQEVDREPFFCQFSTGGKAFTLASFHAVPKSKQPETEIKYFKFLPDLYPGHNLIFCGDFNLPPSHTVFNPLRKMGYRSALNGQKTSLKQVCAADNCLASEYDNFYFKPAAIQLSKAGAIHFYRDFDTMNAARKISDHIPVYLNITWNTTAR